MSSLADLLRSQNFGPNDSLIASSINHPLRAGKKLSDWIARQTQTAAGIPEQYDNPNPLLAPSPNAQSQAAFDLAGLVQGGSMPFAPATKGGTLGSITAWHGSPHKFDKFSMDKIGTGEGAQAYGHGLYFAESPDVAQQYAQTLGKRLLNGKEIDENLIRSTFDSNEKTALRKIMQMGPEQALKFEKNNDVKKAIERIVPNVDIQKNLYKTSLEWPDPAREAADPLGPHHFLDWDKPLSEQPDSIKKGLTKFRTRPHWTGQMFHGELADLEQFENMAPLERYPEIQKMLLDSGIPGIRYLDGGSRGAGEGSYNYVIFDDKIPKIKERNGNPLSKLLPATMLGYGMANQRSLSDYFGAQ